MWLQVIDLLWDVTVCLALMNCDVLRPLLIAWTSSLVVTVLSNLCVGWRVLEKLERGHPSAAAWIRPNIVLTTLVLFASASRIESLSVLRCLGMRMPDRHFNFLRFEGAHQYVLADVPHLMAAIAMLWIGFKPEDTTTHQSRKPLRGLALLVILAVDPDSLLALSLCFMHLLTVLLACLWGQERFGITRLLVGSTWGH